MKYRTALFAAATASMTVPAIVSSAIASSATGNPGDAMGGHGTLTIGVSQFPDNFHPNIESMAAKFYIADMGQRMFTGYSPDWILQCFLCTEVPTLENGLAELETTPEGDAGIAVTFDIHPEATWGDGTAVTTEDVMFTWEAGRNPVSAFRNSEFYRTVYDITVHDEKTFTLHMNRVTFDYNRIPDFRLLPAHIESAVFDDNPREYKQRTSYDADTTNPGLYFGPYRITEVETGSFVVLEPNETWYGDGPHFDRIVIRTIENTSALEANLLSGEVDMISGELGLTIDQALAFRDRHGDDYDVDFVPGLVYEHIDLNLNNPVLADIRVRRALLYGADRDALTEQLFQGEQPVAHTNISPLDAVSTDDVTRYNYDPERAVALLEEAGFDSLENGVRVNGDGDRLSFAFQTTSGNRTRELVQQVLQSQWSEIGIEVTIDNEPARVFFGQTTAERRFEGLAMYAWISAPENPPREQLHSGHIPTEENNWAGQNFPGYVNPVMDEALEALEEELDAERRLAHWVTVQQLYADDLPILPLYFRANPFILPNWLDGLEPTGHLHQSTNHVENWRRNDL
ncbi:peptide ABC transporter substrate-binding protein [Fodinicurvata sp. EGI_FJ10296]|uniref:peptide ABC transporter substrate-binding protein n=1 Tax=Fodinicurvata sp. EGI_FJ10296 TaxID=3231908 RepID=UPI003451448D